MEVCINPVVTVVTLTALGGENKQNVRQCEVAAVGRMQLY